MVDVKRLILRKWIGMIAPGRVRPLLAACVTLLLVPFVAAERPHRPPVLSAPTADRAQGYAVPDSLDDGPHVYWRGDGSATVFYQCNGELRADRYAVVDTLSFRGLCSDSAVTYRIPAVASGPEPYEFNGASQILAVSDIHGEYEALVEVLRGAGVIDERLAWSWGGGHLVVVGDVFDRGDRVTECLWLIHSLERQAAAAGGRVHYVLGNHELMVLRGDLRYVNDKYIDGIVRNSDIDYQDMFGPDMELGRWLRGKNAIVAIDGIVFVHGGLSPAVVRMGLDMARINAAIRRAIDAPSYKVAFDDTLSFLLGSEGPLWYRGYHRGIDGRYAPATAADVAAVTDRYRARAIVVGHTEVDSLAVMHDGRVYGIDIPVDEFGGLEGLLWSEGRFYRVDARGARTPLR